MSTSSGSTIILKSLFRSLLKQSRILDQSPIHQCFLIAKPKKIYIHEYGTAVNVRLYNTDFEIIERVLHEHCGGEYFAPSYSNQEPQLLQHKIKQYFRFGIPSKFDPLKILDPTQKNQSNQEILNKYLELAFYAKKRLSYSTNLINKMSQHQQAQFLNAFNTFGADIKDDYEGGRFTRMQLPAEFSIKSLTPSVSPLLSSEPIISKGSLLISHPLACLGQSDLYRKVIYIIENSSDRIVGITLNAAHAIFDDNARNKNNKNKQNKNKMTSTEFEYCFRGWKGEWNYSGGPVIDSNCPFCVLHENKTLYEKFKESSTQIINDNTYWTWVTAHNYQAVYSALNQITRIIQHKDNKSEISGKNEGNNQNMVDNDNDNDNNGVVDDAQIISESESDDIINDEFYESIMKDDENHFKFFQKYAYWSPEQLNVEIKNNVWFPAKLEDVNEEKQLLNLKCPSPKLLKLKDSQTDHKKQFNKWMWQAFVKGLGNQYKYLSVFPDLNNEQTKEFYAFMEEFHNSWVPDIEHESFDSDDEEEEEDTVW